MPSSRSSSPPPPPTSSSFIPPPSVIIPPNNRPHHHHRPSELLEMIKSRPKPHNSATCEGCKKPFGFFRAGVNCRNCGLKFCGYHLSRKVVLYHLGYTKPEVCCNDCFTRLFQNLSLNSPTGAESLWKKDKTCRICNFRFTFFDKRHHCRNCGDSVCGSHSTTKMFLYHKGTKKPVRVCDKCRHNLIQAAKRAGFDSLMHAGGAGNMAAVPTPPSAPPVDDILPVAQEVVYTVGESAAPRYKG